MTENNRPQVRTCIVLKVKCYSRLHLLLSAFMEEREHESPDPTDQFSALLAAVAWVLHSLSSLALCQL